MAWIRNYITNKCLILVRIVIDNSYISFPDHFRWAHTIHYLWNNFCIQLSPAIFFLPFWCTTTITWGPFVTAILDRNQLIILALAWEWLSIKNSTSFPQIIFQYIVLYQTLIISIEVNNSNIESALLRKYLRYPIWLHYPSNSNN